MKARFATKPRHSDVELPSSGPPYINVKIPSGSLTDVSSESSEGDSERADQSTVRQIQDEWAGIQDSLPAQLKRRFVHRSLFFPSC
jgi:hypothetical protein